MKMWALLPALLWSQVALGIPSEAGSAKVLTDLQPPKERDLLQDLYWLCGARQRLEFGKAVGDLDTQEVLLTEAMDWFRFRLDEQIEVAATNVVDAIDTKRVPETLIMRILEVRVDELPESEKDKFERKQLIAVVQYIPVWMSAQGQW